ncbi:hypothetical protein L914_03959 [Phytophthora nicotianae]|uniref:Uncharacterized protein n=1 Tax=Phytophthora nicotianae TaxID=4792 RepID=W2NXM6_PHYNI|nr:hypothetical protein L914_03959 [Phytophthora nicotianae]
MSKYKSHQIKNPNPSVGKSKQPAFSPRGTNGTHGYHAGGTREIATRSPSLAMSPPS